MNIGEVRRPIAITMGDPAGIGPEVVLQAFAVDDLFRRCRPFVVGDIRILERARNWIEPSEGRRVHLTAITDPEHAVGDVGVLPVLNVPNAEPASCPPGKVSAAAGNAAVEYVREACELVWLVSCLRNSLAVSLE